MYSVWRTTAHRQPDARTPRGRRAARLTVPSQALHFQTPVFDDSTFINDTIRREHSPPHVRDE